jgi:serine/threonine-protein kinase
MATRNTLGAQKMMLVGRYELLAPLLSGALGELWQARIASGPEAGRIVDIRRIPRVEGLEMRYVERLTNAGFAAMELRHPRIAAVLDVVVGAAEIAIVSEHITGAILQTLVRPEPGKRVSVPIGVASRIALDLLAAVEALKAPWGGLFPSADTPEDLILRSCVHGGLIPDGLLIATFGETMLLEAGLAGVALTIPAIVDQPDVIAYRAPEQLEPGRIIDERTDVFTVGILLWEMIAGRSLFGPSVLPRPGAQSPSKAVSGADFIQVSAARRRVLSHPVPRLDSLPLLKGKVKKDLADFVARCLERDPDLRFQSAREAISAFSNLEATSLSEHAAVVKLVSSLGIGESHGAPTEKDPSRFDSELAPSTDVESVPPTVPPTDSIPVMGSDVESIPAGAGDSVPALGNDVESVPPWSEEPTTVLPAAAMAIALAGAEGSITLMSGAPPRPAEPAQPVEAAANAALPAVSAQEPAPQAEAPIEVPRVDLGAIPEEEPAPASLARRDRGRRVVVGIIAAAAVLVLIAVLRAALSSAGEAAPSSTAATRAVASTSVASPPVVIEVPPTPEPSAPRERPPHTPLATNRAAPTSVPAGTTSEPAEGSTRKQTKKRPFRPSGI